MPALGSYMSRYKSEIIYPVMIVRGEKKNLESRKQIRMEGLPMGQMGMLIAVTSHQGLEEKINSTFFFQILWAICSSYFHRLGV